MAVVFVGCLLSCKAGKKTELLWTQTFHQIGSQSSPRLTDLNADGTLDVVMGACRAEMDSVDQGVLALDGVDGSLLWQVTAPASVVGSATFLDITKDGIDDVFIGGRNMFLAAINGATGEVLWQYQPDLEHPVRKYAHYNFYNSTLVPDQNRDGLEDLLIVNGGNWDAAPGSTTDRFPGVLMLFSSADGEVIAADTMPDGKESYMSPVIFQQPDDVAIEVIFGTGGETVAGHLYHTTLEALLQNDISQADRLVSAEHGFIAPPVIADLNADGYYDIIAASHDSKIIAIDGRSRAEIWSKNFPGMESSNSFAVGYFNGDDIPDVCTAMSKGTWPHYSCALHVMLDGKDGEVQWTDSSSCFSLTTPVAADLTGNGRHEILLSKNIYDCSIRFSPDTLAPPEMANELVVVDFQTGATQVIDHTNRFMNIFSTPWVGDIDEDGYLDIIYPQYYNPTDIRRFLGMQMKRISTSKLVPGMAGWSGYQGNQGKSIFPMDAR